VIFITISSEVDDTGLRNSVPMKSSQLLQAIFFVASRQKRETQTDIDLGDTGQAARAALQSPTKRAPLRGIVSDDIRWHDLLRLTLTSGRG